MLKILFFSLSILLLCQLQNVAGARSRSSRSRNVTQLTIVVSAFEGSHVATGTLLRPHRTPRVIAKPGKTFKIRLPLDITVNSIFIRKTKRTSKRRRCSKRNRLDANGRRLPKCYRTIRLNIPINLLVPTNVETAAVETDRVHTVHSSEIQTPLSFGGLPQEFFQSEVAIGDPVRSRRVKRTGDNYNSENVPRIRQTNPIFTD